MSAPRKIVVVGAGMVGLVIAWYPGRCGAWSARLLRRLGIRVPLETQRGYHVELPAESLGICRIVAPYNVKAFITPMEHALRIAGTVEMAGPDAPPSPHRVEAIMARIAKAFPQLASAMLDEAPKLDLRSYALERF